MIHCIRKGETRITTHTSNKFTIAAREQRFVSGTIICALARTRRCTDDAEKAGIFYLRPNSRIYDNFFSATPRFTALRWQSTFNSNFEFFIHPLSYANASERMVSQGKCSNVTLKNRIRSYVPTFVSCYGHLLREVRLPRNRS